MSWEWRPTSLSRIINKLWVDGRGLILAAGEGVFLSEDAGARWTQLRPRTSTYSALCVAPDETLYAGSTKGAIHISRDKGKQWVTTRLRGGQPVRGIAANQQVAIAITAEKPFLIQHGEDTWEPSSFASDGFSASQVTTDDSGRFYVCGSKKALKPDPLYGPGGMRETYSGVLLYSDNNGATWKRAPIPKCEALKTIATSGDAVYAAGNLNLFLRSLRRSAWEQLPLSGADNRLCRYAERPSLWADGAILLMSLSSGVLRSDDSGDTWVVLRDFDDSLGPVDESVDVIASATGHIYRAGSRSGVSMLEDTSLRASLSPSSISFRGGARQPIINHNAEKLSTSWELWLDRLLAVWRETREVRVARLIKEVGERVTPGRSSALTSLSRAALHRRWIEVSRSATAIDMGPLLQTLFHGAIPDILQRVRALESLPEDPRVAAALAAWVPTFAFGSTSSRSLWVAVFRLLEKLAEKDTAEALSVAANQKIPLSGFVMRAWMESALPATAQAIAMAAMQRGQPLTGDMLALCAEVEAALHPAEG